MYIWDFCYRYEVYIALAIAILCLFVGMELNNQLNFAFVSIIGAGIIVKPLYRTKSKYESGWFEKREEIGQFRFMLSTVFGWCGMAILLANPIMMLKDHFSYELLAVAILCYPIIYVVYIFMNDYSKWRFDWAYDNYDMLWSSHYRWWISLVNYDVQKTNLKLFRSYKTHAATFLIAGSLCGLLLGFCLPPNPNLSSKSVPPPSNQSVTEEVGINDDTVNSQQLIMSDVQSEDAESGFFEENEDNDEQSTNYIGNDEIAENNNYRRSYTQDNANENERTASRRELDDDQCYYLNELSEKPQFPSEGNAGFRHVKLAVMDHVRKQLGGRGEGKIYVDFCVNTRGETYNIDTSLIHDDKLREDVKRIFKSLRFIPAKKNGHPVNVSMNISM